MNIYDAIDRRRSVRQYSDRPIPDEVLDRLKRAMRSAPSACNYQPWHFILVTDPELRHQIAVESRKQDWMGLAPVTLVACGYPHHAYKKMGGYWNSVDVDVAIALDHLMLAAAAEGLGTCWIGAFDESRIKPLLNIPDNVKVVAMTPLGFPADESLIHKLDETLRRPDADIFSMNEYSGDRH